MIRSELKRYVEKLHEDKEEDGKIIKKMDRRNLFYLEKLQIYDILNASNTSTYEWIKFIGTVKKLLIKKYIEELYTGKKGRIKI